MTGVGRSVWSFLILKTSDLTHVCSRQREGEEKKKKSAVSSCGWTSTTKDSDWKKLLIQDQNPQQSEHFSTGIPPSQTSWDVAKHTDPKGTGKTLKPQFGAGAATATETWVRPAVKLPVSLKAPPVTPPLPSGNRNRQKRASRVHGQTIPQRRTRTGETELRG